MKKLSKPLHIFRAGRHTTTTGETIEFSEADLLATARAYNPANHKAPIVKGHPALDDPAHGWIAGLSVNANGLFANPEKVSPEFAEEVKAGGYGTISAKFYRPSEPTNPVKGTWYLRHVGFLGAQPPAIKGLTAPEFAESKKDDGCVCFHETIPLFQSSAPEFAELSRSGISGIARTFRALREWIISKDGIEKADNLLPDYRITGLEDDLNSDLNKSQNPSPTFSETNQENSMTLEELQEQNKKLQANLYKANADKAAATAKTMHTANVQFAESLTGKLAPKHKDLVVATLDQLSVKSTDEKPVQFGEGDNAKPIIEAFKTFLGELPPVVEFAEVATKANGQSATTEQNPLIADAESRSK